ncbi:AbrB family transcriptional regulator [Desulforamulus profundi]|uniref:AbrB family transcriptional regulator n=1 Tax=Desulforamulus profundi TaxID=1383067 RepID=A0A2C6LGE7_9FIRM|nr:AbrB/MazE/SpoVT family DNA-binding domain-containing protein [Desulforamulus profundi]PHJ37110.1 AbrB family transcriptional regulator [Desulforamulus profundi]
MYTVKISSRGQIVIPVEARNSLNLNLKEGDTLACYVEEGRIVLKSKQAKAKKGIVDQTYGLLPDIAFCTGNRISLPV